MFFIWRNIVIGITFLGMIAGMLVPSISWAQTPDELLQSYQTMVNEGDFEFIVTPKNPGPHQKVTIRLDSNLVDVNRYSITWTVNGSTVASGVGNRQINITTGNYGEITDIVMSITLVESTVNKRIVIAPQDAAMLWEAIDSYVPPFYRGKKLPSYEGFVRIISMPNFLADKTAGGAKTGVYTWKRNNSAITGAGGYGKNSITIQHNKVREFETVEVTASTQDSSAQSKMSIIIPFFAPKILFYEQNSETGLKLSNAKNVLYLTGDTTRIVAEPYFFSTGLDSDLRRLALDWKMNGESIAISNINQQNKLTLRKPGAAGAATISLDITNPNYFLQSAKNAITAVFK